MPLRGSQRASRSGPVSVQAETAASRGRQMRHRREPPPPPAGLRESPPAAATRVLSRRMCAVGEHQNVALALGDAEVARARHADAGSLDHAAEAGGGTVGGSVVHDHDFRARGQRVAQVLHRAAQFRAFVARHHDDADLHGSFSSSQIFPVSSPKENTIRPGATERPISPVVPVMRLQGAARAVKMAHGEGVAGGLFVRGIQAPRPDAAETVAVGEEIKQFAVGDPGRLHFFAAAIRDRNPSLPRHRKRAIDAAPERSARWSVWCAHGRPSICRRARNGRR